VTDNQYGQKIRCNKLT